MSGRPKKQETTSMDLRIAYKTILDALCEIQYEECAQLLEDCFTERARIKDLDVDVSESEEEESGDETNYSSCESEDDS
jgi:hypothetical protein